MRIFGIDPGSERTGYGCVETDGRRLRLVTCGAICAVAGDTFPERLSRIHRELSRLLSACRPDTVAIESLFFAMNVRSALKLGHARGVAMLAATQSGCTVAEYSPAEVKRAVVGYGRAEKHQVQQMIKLLLGLEAAPSPHDAADALAVAICHLHSVPPLRRRADLKVRPYDNHPHVGDPDANVRSTPRTAPRRGGPSGPPDPGVTTGRPARATPSAPPKSWRQYRPPTV